MHRSNLDTWRQPAEDGFLRAARFIEASIGRPISLRDVAARSEWSTCHFHRVFRARVGLPVMDYVRRRRLTLAAKRLIESDVPVLEIALDAGFNSQAAFTRAFSRVYRRPPAAYRARGREVPWLSVSPITGGTLALLPGLGSTSPRCMACPRLCLAGLEMTLTARERDAIPAMWRKLAAVLRANNLRASVGYGLSDPVPHVADGLLTYAATVSVDDVGSSPGGLITRDVSAGRYLVFPFQGPRAGLPIAIDYLYGTWIPGSGHRLRRASTLETYSSLLESDKLAVIELWIPIA